MQDLRSKTMRRRDLTIGAVKMAAGLAITGYELKAFAQGRDVDAGITDGTILLGTDMPMSGPVAAQGPTGRGMKVYFEYINKKYGGVKMADGKRRLVHLRIYDDAFDPARALRNARTMVEVDHVFAELGSLGTAVELAVRPYFNKMKVPQLFLSTGAPQWGTQQKEYPWTMGLWPAYSTEAAIYAGYLKKTKPKAKIALIGDDSGGPLFTKAFQSSAKDNGLELVSVQQYSNSDPSITAKIDAMAHSGADTFVDASTAKFTIQGIRHMADIGWKPMHIIWGVSSSIGAVLNVAGSDVSKGILTGLWFKDPTNPALQRDPDVVNYLEQIKQFDSSIKPDDTFAVMGWVAAGAGAAALERAQPTRESVLAAEKSLKNVRVSMLLDGITLNTGKDDPFPIESLRMAQFNGKVYDFVGGIVSYEGKTPKI